MATMKVSGFEHQEARLNQLGAPMIKKIVMAGANAAMQEMIEVTLEKRHVRNGDMLKSIGTNEYREFLHGGSVDVYPQGDDGQGVRNATKAYVTNYGKGQRPYTRRPKKHPRKNLTGDKFITGHEKTTEAAVAKAMQAESDRLMEELNK